MAHKKNDGAFCVGRTGKSNPGSGNGPLWAPSPEERTALIRKIREKIDALEYSKLQHLYSILKRLEIVDE